MSSIFFVEIYFNLWIKISFEQYYGSVKKTLEYQHKVIVSDFHRSRWEEGDWTDDSDQMLLILMSITDNKGKVRPRQTSAKIRYYSTLSDRVREITLFFRSLPKRPDKLRLHGNDLNDEMKI